MMELRDDRTAAQRETHTVIVLWADSFMSGWGRCRDGGTSYAGWACRPEHADTVERWVRSRDEMKRVRVVDRDYTPGTLKGHCHIYVVNDGHRALS